MTKKHAITFPKGFKAAGISCGIKKSGKPDLALIVSDVPAAAAAMFTTSKIKAAPVILSRKQIKSGIAQAIIANSGNANACTGKTGLKDAQTMIDDTAKSLALSGKKVLVASTGSIGKPLPIKKIKNGIKIASEKLSVSGGSNCAKAILTTDTVAKQIAVEITVGSKKVRIAGIAKGSGMINPDLSLHATMFAFITTDALINSKTLSKALKESADKSFNMITVDNDQSTNDTVFAMANGLSKCQNIKSGTAEYKKFQKALESICVYLAKEIARDGEGATKLIEVNVYGAKTLEHAKNAAKAIVGSDLVKAAVFGEDPNWGRVMAALGYCGALFDPNRVEVSIGSTKVFKSGSVAKFNFLKAKSHMKGKVVIYNVNLHAGMHSATAWGCDLTYGYVKINADYHT